MLFGIPQGLIPDFLLFRFFLVDLLVIENSMDIANYSDDDVSYATGNDIDRLIDSVEEASKSFFYLDWQ